MPSHSSQGQTADHNVRSIDLALILLMVVALAATWIPARRATKVNPVVALR